MKRKPTALAFFQCTQDGLKKIVHPLGCVLCGASAPYHGMFFPNKKSLAYGRVCAYSLCAACYSRPDRDAAVERVIEAEIIRTN